MENVNYEHVWLVVIAGGKGTRLFLFSNSYCPKQFCQMDEDSTFIQATIARFLALGIDPRHIVVVVTNEIQRQLSIEQVVDNFKVLSDNIILIDPGHGYAGAMLVATSFINQQDGDAIIIQTPSDQYVEQCNDFKSCVEKGIEVCRNGNPVIIGKRITNADVAKELGNIIYSPEDGDLSHRIEDFIEKPNIETISQIMRTKSSACNTGINIWKSNMIGQYQDNTPIATDTLINEILIEPRVIIGTFGWEDCGTFKALYQLNRLKNNNNVIGLSNANNIEYKDCGDALLITESTIELDVYGVSKVAIVAREIDNEYYLEIASFDAVEGVAKAAELFESCPTLFKEGVTIGGKNNGFTCPQPDKYHVCFIGVSGYKVNTYNRRSGKRGFNISKGI